jgi:hypothetical protein
MTTPNPPVDSREGIQMLADYARAGGFVLTERHEQIAKKYGVSFDGVIVSRQIPTEEPSA